MIPENIRIRGATRENRYEMIDYAVHCIHTSSGWITNHNTFSDKVIVIHFEIEIKGVRRLLELLNGNGLKLLDESVQVIENFPEAIEKEYGDKEIKGSIQITFISAIS
ncbi:hypothetical protein MUG87_02480 [Ectobacillus sp. JY-23]|uniref:hypothetical protein n=1 Tax=Ectobacillus sp. JY-23 TaxID=2933872 RepID=UPI001FF6DFF1|nr:hypothetical protein [Ectobacillus sp. JY-23]UOY93023.1 hypothetical protein MUG87_02480 [Ectobacillus sp. JY-23]